MEIREDIKKIISDNLPKEKEIDEEIWKRQNNIDFSTQFIADKGMDYVTGYDAGFHAGAKWELQEIKVNLQGKK